MTDLTLLPLLLLYLSLLASRTKHRRCRRCRFYVEPERKSRTAIVVARVAGAAADVLCCACTAPVWTFFYCLALSLPPLLLLSHFCLVLSFRNTCCSLPPAATAAVVPGEGTYTATTTRAARCNRGRIPIQQLIEGYSVHRARHCKPHRDAAAALIEVFRSRISSSSSTSSNGSRTSISSSLR